MFLSNNFIEANHMFSPAHHFYGSVETMFQHQVKLWFLIMTSVLWISSDQHISSMDQHQFIYGSASVEIVKFLIMTW
jgi:hypothetical protein